MRWKTRIVSSVWFNLGLEEGYSKTVNRTNCNMKAFVIQFSLPSFTGFLT